ncbi:DEAD/DEAH box helicase [Saccharomonospora iraqiensis]|uniref:DEAD/DEAH box helicase n=1 Tax=Saccharomonospora iraqiensis TaxID=52698 RepID=UPI0003F914BA|nr:DEAD/DEAH box helicase [Saccharomonospora iraqiensis]
MTFDPLAASTQLDEGYRRYLRSLLSLRDPALADALERAIDNSPTLIKGPLLEATPAYAPGASLADLVQEGVLSRQLLSFASPALPADRPLYRHQEQAIRKAVAGRNIVVATGTGSGKTESFLVPVLEHLARERANGRLGPGVRALLLYPMNALANDQLKRLRRILADISDITFGRYTGETEETPDRAEEKFHQLNPGEPRLDNELLSRREMRREPPHLLLTNYAMLEYLLLRPQDMDLFDGPHAGTWSHIILDEAHVYDGAKGAELAMLLRRLIDRVGNENSIRAIATSATVGSDRDPEAVTQFASSLFNLPFEWKTSDTAAQDVVSATVQTHPVETTWGPLPASRYAELAESSDPAASVLEAARAHGWTTRGETETPADAATVLRAEERLRTLHNLLTNGPRALTDLITALFGEDPVDDTTAREALTNLVTLANRVRGADDSPVLSSRYHLFARASEGAFSCLGSDGPHLSLSRHEKCQRCSRVVFELGGCRRCGTVHLHGAFDTSGTVVRHVPYRSGIDRRHAWLLLEDAHFDGVVAEDEDDALFSDEKAAGISRRYLCTTCGALHEQAPAHCAHEDCSGTEFRAVQQLDPSTDTLNSCVLCGAVGPGTVRLFESGNEAAVSVLGTSLYQTLPPGQGDSVDLPGQGRKLLFFSDSRQMAAYFAPYLQETHGRLTRRRLILQGLHRHADAEDGEPATIEDLIDSTAKIAKRARVFDEDTSGRARTREVSRWVMQEVISFDERQSLEGTGLLRMELARKAHWAPPQSLTGFGLEPQECWDLLQELVRTLRRQGALDMPEDVEASHDAFRPRRGPIYMRGSGSEKKKKVLSWLPDAASNTRTDYVKRILQQLDARVDTREVLDKLWNELDPTQPGDGPHSWLSSQAVSKHGIVRQINHRKVRLRPVAEGEALFRCDRCRRITAVSVRGVCPTYRCDGELRSWHRPVLSDEGNHYRLLYLDSLPVPMKVREHTAQWTSEKAAEIQGEFVRGEVNALSCSTTFELGVDVGELQAVVLRNMPPTTANYVQRAGRAGRRSDAAALVLTFAQRRSHDLSRFADPATMISGETRPPVVPLENVRIDRRHAHSVALAAFFRTMKAERHQTWTTAGDFFLRPDPAPSDYVLPCELVRSFLAPVPDDVQASLDAVLPPAVAKAMEVENDGWVDELVNLLEKARAQLEHDVTAFEARKAEATREENFALAGQCKRVLATLRKQPLINFLANHNVLPKYGFPVDTVELRTSTVSNEGAQLELTRDLSMAISEYAPGSQVVAGGKRWTSGGVYRLPGRGLVTRYYVTCEKCGHYREDVDTPDVECPSCKRGARRAALQYAEPTYGFVACSSDAQGAAEPPRRAGSIAKYLVDTQADLRQGLTHFPTGGILRWRAGARGLFVVINEGPQRRGFYLCQTCGWGTPANKKIPREHQHLLNRQTCKGTLVRQSLAHRYETDFVEVRIDGLAALAPAANYRSAVYALLEGASTALEISRDDIDGTVHRGSDGRPSLVLFDTTPGGAGNALRIADALDTVVPAAMARVAGCECGEETSCYGCLRGFSNDRYHEELSRHAAMELLEDLVPRP